MKVFFISSSKRRP